MKSTKTLLLGILLFGATDGCDPGANAPPMNKQNWVQAGELWIRLEDGAVSAGAPNYLLPLNNSP